MRKLLVITTVFVMAVGCWSQEMAGSNAASKEDVERLYATMKIRERTELVMTQSRNQSKVFLTDFLVNQVPGAKEKRTQVQDMVEEMIKGIFKDYPTDKILEESIPIYQKHLTRADVDALISFYSTAAGQKMLQEMPAIISESSQLTQSQLQPRLQAAATKLTEELTKMLDNNKSPNAK